MSAEIVNLRQVRKRKAREASAGQAAENRARFGRSKSERRLEAAKKAMENERLEGMRRDVDDPREGS